MRHKRTIESCEQMRQAAVYPHPPHNTFERLQERLREIIAGNIDDRTASSLMWDADEQKFFVDLEVSNWTKKIQVRLRKNFSINPRETITPQIETMIETQKNLLSRLNNMNKYA